MKTGILFDLDGTLLNTLEDLMDATNRSLALFGYPQRSLEEVRRFVGNGAGRLIAQAVPEGADPAPVLAAFQADYPEHCQVKTAPYPGILEALATLQEKYPIAIVSNKPDTAVKPLCAAYFPGVFALGETKDCPRKPAPQMIKKAMEAIGADRCIYVGDSEVDVLTAKNAGVPCLSVLWGFREEDEIGGSRYCHQVRQLVPMLEEMAEAL